MERILHIVGSVEKAGIETFLMNLYRRIDTDKYQFDFAIYNAPSDTSYRDEIVQRGGKIFLLPKKADGIIDNYRAIKSVVSQNHYNIVWRSTDSCVGGIDLLAACLGGAKVRILHSHSSSVFGKMRYAHKALRPVCNELATIRFACGDKAGRWMFGNKGFTIIPNCIDTDSFKYNYSIRDKLRNEYGLTDKVVIGHVGRFDKVKNHLFLIKLFAEYSKEYDDSALVLIGVGDTEDQCRQLVKEYGKEDKVLFLGVRSDISDLLQMIDVMVMPSFYEGFPVTMIEAQASGLPIIASTGVSKETDIYGLVKYISLESDLQQWIEEIHGMIGKRDKQGYKKVYDAGFDVNQVVKRIEEALHRSRS